MLKRITNRFGPSFQQSRTNRYDVRVALLFLLLPLSIAGCTSATLKLTGSENLSIKRLRIAAMETPPLEVVPDLLTVRMPVYAHYDNMALPILPETKLYRLPGDIVIAGRVGEGDSVDIIDPTITQTSEKKLSGWSLSSEILQLAVAQFARESIQAVADDRLRLLPMATSERNADLVHWHNAVEKWYAANLADDLYVAEDDGVLELGIGQYRIFSGQLSVQLLIKLINPSSGKVIARIKEKSTVYEGSVETLLSHNGEKLKKSLRQHIAHLLALGLRDIGLLTE